MINMSDQTERTGRNLPIRKTKLSDQGKEKDLDSTTPEERIGMMWELALDAWSFTEGFDAESRLPRHIVRVLRREG